MLDMKQLWQYLDNEVNITPMPKEYDNFFVDILCKDCHQESSLKFHVVGLKCQNRECGGYNTTRTQKRKSTKESAAASTSNDNDAKDDNNDGACSSNNNTRNEA
jgi:RING finger/CHY zinc finger protein 1